MTWPSLTLMHQTQNDANDMQPFRCVTCNKPVSHINPELTPCDCEKAIRAAETEDAGGDR